MALIIYYFSAKKTVVNVRKIYDSANYYFILSSKQGSIGFGKFFDFHISINLHDLGCPD